MDNFKVMGIESIVEWARQNHQNLTIHYYNVSETFDVEFESIYPLVNIKKHYVESCKDPIDFFIKIEGLEIQ